MTESTPNEPGHHHAKKGFAFAHLAFILALIPPLLLLGCMMVTHLGYVGYDLGFKTLTLHYGPKLATVTLAIGALSLLISLFMAPKRCAPWALAAVAISGALLAGFSWYRTTLKSFPPIADVATNWDRPLTLSDQLTADRGPKAKVVEDLPRVPRDESLEWGGKTIPDINSLTCPGAHPIMRTGITPAQIEQILTSEHYTIFGEAPWRVEGTYQDNFFGFKSDVVVRMDAGRIDVRSISRYDMPDMGLNCRHVTAIVNKIAALPDVPDASVDSQSYNAFSGQSAMSDGGDGGGDGGGD